MGVWGCRLELQVTRESPARRSLSSRHLCLQQTREWQPVEQQNQTPSVKSPRAMQIKGRLVVLGLIFSTLLQNLCSTHSKSVLHLLCEGGSGVWGISPEALNTGSRKGGRGRRVTSSRLAWAMYRDCLKIRKTQERREGRREGRQG